MCLDTDKQKQMKIKDFVSKTRAGIAFALLGKLTKVDIPEIPKEWTNFFDTDDKWIGFDFPESENTSACIYIGKKGNNFAPHIHPKGVVEHLVILNRTGHVKIITPTYIKEYKFPETIFFESEEPHYVEFIEETKFLCMWHPKMKGWSADFINK